MPQKTKTKYRKKQKYSVSFKRKRLISRFSLFMLDYTNSLPKDAPPLLIMTRVDHPNVAAGLVALFMEWKKAGANAELHMYGDGKGPYELMPQTGETTTETWSTQMIQWLKARGFVKN